MAEVALASRVAGASKVRTSGVLEGDPDGAGSKIGAAVACDDDFSRTCSCPFSGCAPPCRWGRITRAADVVVVVLGCLLGARFTKAVVVVFDGGEDEAECTKGASVGRSMVSTRGSGGGGGEAPASAVSVGGSVGRSRTRIGSVPLWW